jgi:hypothetical protein
MMKMIRIVKIGTSNESLQRLSLIIGYVCHDNISQFSSTYHPVAQGKQKKSEN